MAGVYPTLRMLIFQENGRDDPYQNLLVCEVIWPVKQVQYYDTKLAQLVTTFRDRAMTWYMKYQTTMKNRTLVGVKDALIKEIKNWNMSCNTILS